MNPDSIYIRHEPANAIVLFKYWNIAWHNRLVITAITATFAIASVVYSLSLPDIYRSETLLVSTESRQTNSFAARRGLPIGLGSNFNSQTAKAIAVLQSRDFIRHFIAKRNLLISLMAGKWSSEHNSSIIDSTVYDELTASWVAEPPSEWDAYRAFSNMLTVSDDPTSSLITVAIEWHDPYQTRQWLDWLIKDINMHIKDQVIIEASSAIQYLQGQLQTTRLVDIQSTFYQLIELQTRLLMLTNVRDEYIFKTIDPAYLPETKTRPRRAVISLVGTLLGGLVAIAAATLLHHRAELKEAKK